ncbi:hypothetical protein Cgig2_014875 [Carnegiea gigantea]|uniref:Uncharacterized protein n=1 Tax=Carnegiea gigantea TaxID=171969 RepID=A0A9Q1JH89_9CARY|nr:hypothetical protein Cgig2_014875 [Carnegiea gigantea]
MLHLQKDEALQRNKRVFQGLIRTLPLTLPFSLLHLSLITLTLSLSWTLHHPDPARRRPGPPARRAPTHISPAPWRPGPPARILRGFPPSRTLNRVSTPWRRRVDPFQWGSSGGEGPVGLGEMTVLPLGSVPSSSSLTVVFTPLLLNVNLVFISVSEGISGNALAHAAHLRQIRDLFGHCANWGHRSRIRGPDLGSGSGLLWGERNLRFSGSFFFCDYFYFLALCFWDDILGDLELGRRIQIGCGCGFGFGFGGFREDFFDGFFFGSGWGFGDAEELGIMSARVYMWATVMDRRGAHKRQHRAMIMASFVEEAAAIGMIWSKKVVREQV